MRLAHVYMCVCVCVYGTIVKEIDLHMISLRLFHVNRQTGVATVLKTAKEFNKTKIMDIACKFCELNRFEVVCATRVFQRIQLNG